MNSVLEVLYLRRPSIDYISPPVCEFDFSASGGPVIVLDALGALAAPTGLILSGIGNFHLSWNRYPGALCYTVYRAVDPANPFGEYVIVAECIEDPEYDIDPNDPPTCYRVSAITENGETLLSDPICVGGCPSIVSGADPSFQSKPAGDSASFTAEVTGPSIEFYHWYKDGSLYLDTTNTTQNNLTISPLALSDAGDYTLRIGNGGCEDESAVAELQVTSVGAHDPIAYWKFDGSDSTPEDVINGFELLDTGNEPGLAGVTGKIAEAFNLPATDDDTCQYDTAFEPDLAPTAAGAEIIVWCKFNAIALGAGANCNAFASYGLLTDSDFGGLAFIYDARNNPGFITAFFDTATVQIAFTPTIGVFHWIRVRYSAITGKVGVAVDGNPITESVGTRFLAGTPVAGTVQISTVASAGCTMDVTFDEMGIFDLAMSDVETDDWWNGGAGRTYP
jgi:hypothetical protein